ncbi:exosortase family protein XrtF [Cloacibacterium normanense]|uniref:exosortase family protein XrtF n=1 Tax=Cloacibacterium normanense TaxID=237258 RepID=UPI00391AA4C1
MKDFKEILWVLLRFLGIWLLLFLLYQWYLNQFSGNIDGFTKIISDQSAFLLNFTGYETVTKDFPSHETVQFYINGKVATRMVEGCNAVSVMIMFLAFVFAFYKGVKTFYFAFSGIVLLYILNLFRIYVLNVIVVDFPVLTKHAHDYFFPAIIYGGVVVLWLIWINKFVITDEKNS